MAAKRVFGIAELLENVLDHMDERTLLLSQRISRTFADTISDSAKYQRKLFFTVDEATQYTCMSDIKGPNGLVQLELKGSLLQLPNEKNKTYHLEHDHGSWQKMHLINPAATSTLEVWFGGDAVRELDRDKRFRTMQYANLPFGALMNDSAMQWRLQHNGLTVYMKGLVERIEREELPLAAVACSDDWLRELRPEAQDPDALRERLTKIRRAVEYVMASRVWHSARKFAFWCAVEELEEREGQRYEASEEMVQMVRDRPALLEIKDDAARLARWRIACLGSA
ncbi:hypothetical protein LTR49_008661 [Elasticomyces elasticus]|nr:hypothetical protein LTR49_008661 [Elasticomyces elasticus]KAK5758490.1 hypothetical protein LTS12_011352 [Elasticomyces elasticus]